MSTIAMHVSRRRRFGIFRRVLAALALRRSRQTLAGADDHILRDVGLTRAEAEAEAARPIWDIPAWWRA
ncbi:DUF1127 domain-containing protein [Roseitranquillus sediminis]|uniref:DUF1127 domain-containing protein n=1 Tax=Roseitranquillus sediminis TaxID=2809051 RepID=UPI001D0C0B52|nr:DUF1127 domain-containing protein [Roseitranquillus sediminis]MBM9595323.1 DUF1127 domain-containing protein [Roseitranquillus sediminis]